jgi:hypothetical protein
MHKETNFETKSDLKEPERNNYFYGQMLDVHQFELQARYHIDMHRRINRLGLGYGVVCGLNVLKPDPGRPEVVVTRGFAIDKWGRDIVVPERSIPLAVPGDLLTKPCKQDVEQSGKEEMFVRVVLCYHECKGDPMPVLASECQSAVTCVPGSIRERYCLDLRKGKADPPSLFDECRFPDVISEGILDYKALAMWVTRGCPESASDPCIPLANISLHDQEGEWVFDEGDIDITIRPIVYTNDLLFDLLMSMLVDSPKHRRGK